MEYIYTNRTKPIHVSVVMPVYNVELYVGEAIESILNQTFAEFEFIIIDDGSTDGSWNIIKSYSDKRILPLRNETNLGNYPSRNAGIKSATGKYIAIMDADDIAYPARLEKQYEYMERNPEITALGTNFDFSLPSMRKKVLFKHEELLAGLLADNQFLHSSLMIKADVINKLGGYNEKYVYSSDYDLMTKLALFGRIENLPEKLMMYRWHGSQISQFHAEKQNEYAYEIRLNYQMNFINRYKGKNKLAPGKWSIGHPQMGQAIALYTYAHFTGDVKFREKADAVLDYVLENLPVFSNVKRQHTLCSIGCGLIYILRNGFADGDENEVLAEIDNLLTSVSFNWNSDNNKSLAGWIHYLTLRVNKSSCTEADYMLLINKENLINFLDRLDGKPVTDALLLEDLRTIHALAIFPARTKRLLNLEAEETAYTWQSKAIQQTDVTFVIPVRIDSDKRKRNLDVVLALLSKREATKIMVMEADAIPVYKLEEKPQNVKYLYVKDNDPVFHRTKYINMLLKEAETAIVGIWDADVVVPDSQIDSAIGSIREGKAAISFPYDGRFVFCSEEDSKAFEQERLISYLKEKEVSSVSFFNNSVGGAFFVNKEVYLNAGGENENFYGWGLEDRERVKRMEIFGLPISRAEGSLFHLFHARNANSWFFNKTFEMKSRMEYLKICSLQKKEINIIQNTNLLS